MSSSEKKNAASSPAAIVFSRFMRNRMAVASAAVFIVILLLCFTGSAFVEERAYYRDSSQQNIPPVMSLLSYDKSLARGCRKIAVGASFAAGLDMEGRLSIWGAPPTAVRAPEAGRFTDIAAGDEHLLALTAEGELISIGSTRLGLADIPDALRKDAGIVKLMAVGSSSAALTADGWIYIWGGGGLSSLSQESADASPYQGRIIDASLTGNNLLLLCSDGEVGVLGSSGGVFSRLNVPENFKAVKIAACESAAILIDADGGFAVTGASVYLPPVEMNGISDIAAGRYHFTAADLDGKLFTWGEGPGAVAPPADIVAGRVFAGYFGSYSAEPDGGINASWGLRGYPAGSDGYGRDVFARLITGGRLTLSVGAAAVAIQTVIGLFVGGCAGYFGGKCDIILMRIAEVVGSIPFLPLAMTLSVIIGSSLGETGRILLIMLILGLLGWSGIAQLIRGRILAEREKDFVLAARALGQSSFAILFRHIIPNIMTVIIVNTALSYGSSLLVESSLSFLGFGVTEPGATWGNMLSGAQSSVVLVNYWWRWFFPALALALSCIAVNIAGDGLRDAADPKLAETR